MDERANCANATLRRSAANESQLVAPFRNENTHTFLVYQFTQVFDAYMFSGEFCQYGQATVRYISTAIIYSATTWKETG